MGRILTAGDAMAALRLLQDPSVRTPDAVLLDIRMPGLDGMELARVLNGLRTPPAVAFLSAHDDRAVEAYEVGAVDYLLKPVTDDRLLATIARLKQALAQPPADLSGLLAQLASRLQPDATQYLGWIRAGIGDTVRPVSYTHLTLPTTERV